MRSLFAPRSIAVVGASNDPDKIGGLPVANLIRSGFSGEIYPINPGHDVVQGLRSYTSVSAVDGDIDCALILVRASEVKGALEDCEHKGVTSAVVFSSGFAELGGEGVLAQDQISRIAKRSGMRVLGPNTIGLSDYLQNNFLTFSRPQLGLKPAAVGVVSQSGGFAGYIQRIAAMHNLTVGFTVGTGNECDLQCGDFLLALAARRDIDVILVYTEGLRNGEQFVSGLEEARRKGKSIIAIKAGSTAIGASAAASHSASLAGEDAVYDAVFREYGVYRASSVEEMVDVAKAALTGSIPRGRRTAIVTLSGAMGVHVADMAVKAGLDLCPVPADARRALDALAPMGASANPIDLTAQIVGDPTMLEKGLDIVLSTGCFDNVITCVGANSQTPESVAVPLNAGMMRVRKKYPDITHSLSAWVTGEVFEPFSDAGFYVAQDAYRSVNTLAAMLRLSEGRRRASPQRIAHLERIELPARTLNEWEAKKVLDRIGIRSPEEYLVQNEAEAVDALARIGGEVALKVVSRNLPHKTEHGGVVLGIRDAPALTQAMQNIRLSLSKLPGVSIEGFLVSKMVKGWIECIVGLHRDPVFGHVVVVGAGGVLVEVIGDVARRLAPVDPIESLDMINETTLRKLLSGFRGAARADIDAIAQAVSSFSQLAQVAGPLLQSFEINPLVVGTEGQGVLALDATAQLIERT